MEFSCRFFFAAVFATALTQHNATGETTVTAVSPIGVTLDDGGRIRKVRFDNRTVLIIEAVTEETVLAKGQMVDVHGTLTGERLKSDDVIIHLNPVLTTRNRIMGLVNLSRLDEPKPVWMTGQIISIDPLRIRSAGLILNTYQVPAVAGGAPQIPVSSNFAGQIMTVEYERVKVFVPQATDLLEPGMTVRVAEKRNFVSSPRITDKQDFNRNRIDKFLLHVVSNTKLTRQELEERYQPRRR